MPVRVKNTDVTEKVDKTPKIKAAPKRSKKIETEPITTSVSTPVLPFYGKPVAHTRDGEKVSERLPEIMVEKRVSGNYPFATLHVAKNVSYQAAVDFVEKNSRSTTDKLGAQAYVEAVLKADGDPNKPEQKKRPVRIRLGTPAVVDILEEA